MSETSFTNSFHYLLIRFSNNSICGMIITGSFFQVLTSHNYHQKNRQPEISLFTLLHGQNSSSPCTSISAMLDTKGRAFVLIQVLYSTAFAITIFKTSKDLRFFVFNDFVNVFEISGCKMMIVSCSILNSMVLSARKPRLLSYLLHHLNATVLCSKCNYL